MEFALQPVKRLLKTKKDNAVFLAYCGPFHDQLTNSILDIAENGMSSAGIQSKLSRRVAFMLVECFQNIVRHAEPEGKGTDSEISGLFSFSLFGDYYVINSINRVAKDRQEEIAGLVEQVNALPAEGLKTAFRKRLNENELSPRGGAGLGLLELARKSGSKVLYRFEPLEDGYCLFHQQVLLVAEPSAHSVPNPDLLNETSELYQNMRKDGLMLEFKGDFSQQTIIPIFQLVGDTFKMDSRLRRKSKAVGHVLVELLQNILKHGDPSSTRRIGALIIGKNGSDVFLGSGNAIGDIGLSCLKKRLEYLSSLEAGELNDLHGRALRASVKFESKTRSGLGLIQIARSSANHLAYTFEELTKGRHLFALGVKL